MPKINTKEEKNTATTSNEYYKRLLHVIPSLAYNSFDCTNANDFSHSRIKHICSVIYSRSNFIWEFTQSYSYVVFIFYHSTFYLPKYNNRNCVDHVELYSWKICVGRPKKKTMTGSDVSRRN